MKIFLLRRFLSMIVSYFLLSLIIFITIQIAPGDYLTNMLAELQEQRSGIRTEAAMQMVENFAIHFGLDKPKWQQYLIWIRNFTMGDMGISFTYQRPVADLLGSRLLLSFIISFASLIFTWGIGIPIGIYVALHKNTIRDYVATFVGFVGLSIPNFFLALALMVLALFTFGMPVGSMFSPAYQDAPWSVMRVLDFIKNLWIPVIVIGTAGTAGTIRVMRGNLLDVLGEPYVTTARAKGVKERIVTRRHAVRIAFNPFVSSLGMTLPALLSGEAITSIVLNLPTAGPLLLDAVLGEDIFMAASILQFYAIFLLIGNLLADIALAVLDPRIRYD